MTDLMDSAARTAFEEGLWKAVGTLRTAADRDAITESAAAREALIATAVRDAQPAARLALLEHADAVHRAAGAARRARVVEEGAAPEPGKRDRTYADRRATLLAESAEAAGAARREAEVAPPAADPAAPPRSLTEAAAKGRRSAREGNTAAREAGFLRFLGEVAYRALPLDDAEKAPLRDSVLEDAAALARSSIGAWELSATAREAGDEIAHALRECGDAALAAATVTEVCGRPDLALGAMTEAAGAELEARIVAAVAATQARARETDVAISECAALGGDPDLVERRVRRTAAGRPTVLEALYVSGRSQLAESLGAAATQAVVLTEAVRQYALLEALSALGVLVVADPSELARKLAARASSAA